MKSVCRVFEIVEHMDRQGKSMSLGEIASGIKVNKSTLYRFLVTLCKLGYVERDAKTKYYRVTPKLARLGSSAGNDLSLISLARPFLDLLSKETGETINMGTIDNTEVYYLDKRDSPHPLRMCIEVGQKGPTHATALGKALLAFLPEEESGSILNRSYPFHKYTDNTLTGWTDLAAELGKIRQEGLAYDNEELFSGLRCISAPIFQRGRAVAAISISAPATRVDEPRLSFFKQILKEITGQLSRQLDYDYADGSTVTALRSSREISDKKRSRNGQQQKGGKEVLVRQIG